MGCSLPKLEKSDESSPGKIYSTLKRPQVETKVDTTYDYKLLDFILAEEGDVESSAVQLFTLSDLPDRLQELYQRGYVLAGFHPFIQSIDGQKKTTLEKMFRAILIKAAESSEENNIRIEPSSLEVESCFLTNQPINSKGLTDVMQNVQEKSRKGFRLVGHVQHQNSSANPTAMPEESSATNGMWNQNKEEKNEQSDVNADEPAQNQDAEGTRGEGSQCEEQVKAEDQPSAKRMSPECPEDEKVIQNESATGGDVEDKVSGKQGALSPLEVRETEGVGRPCKVGTAVVEQSQLATDGIPRTEGHEAGMSAANASEQDVPSEPEMAGGIRKKDVEENEIFLLFNKQVNQKFCKYYTTTIPLKISKKGQDIISLEADWLHHMTEHFTKGALLVDALICLGTSTGVSEEKYEMYDAIVVEQWTVMNGNEVKTDYVPLLNSLAAYGWQLTCVLPTPIMRRDSDGNLATKQIIFLQRPSLPCKEKMKEQKKKSRKDDKPSKKDKNCLKDKNGQVPLQMKISTGVSDQKENLEQSVAKNEDKEDAENRIALETEGNEKGIPAPEAVQNYICVTNGEMGGYSGENTGPEHGISKVCGNNNMCDNVDVNEVQEKHGNKWQNDTRDRSEDEASQTKINTAVNDEYIVTKQHLDNRPVTEMPAEALKKVTGSITETNTNVHKETEGVVEGEGGATTFTE
ncbi:raftlin-like isoform X2 [Narcine bancroftii]|uniref:raftlin-like isoform X2 n=1 Tax=Narcine bancroftii TaxID=1343680 RepID=UPI0038313F95